MGQEDRASKRGGLGVFFFFASCEVVTAPADNNISNISLSAITASSMNRFLSVGGGGGFLFPRSVNQILLQQNLHAR